MIKTYEIHEYAALVPLASDAEQAALNEDIKTNGLQDPIVLWKGKVVDGRCRQQACIYADERIRIKELDENLTDEEVKITVKSLNTRRNLTMTQKVIAACKISLDPHNSLSILELALSWGIKEGLLKNARYISKNAPDLIEPLFNGFSVEIKDQFGKEVMSNKISTVYAYIKRESENVKKDTSEEIHEWKENSYIKTQAGKDWYYHFTKNKNLDMETQMCLAELANFKFKRDEVA